MTGVGVVAIVHPMNGARTGRAALLALAMLAWATLVIFFAAAPIERVLALIPDDASYFFEIAENASSGKGFTFDSLGATNGYQPLWVYFLVPLFRFVPAEPEAMVRIIAVIQVFLSGAALLILHRLLKRICSAFAAPAGALFFVAFVLAPAVNGMESALLVLLLLLTVDRAVRSGFPDLCGRAESFRIGLLLGLVVMARLDTAFLCIAVALLLLLSAIRGKKRKKRIAALGMTTLGASLVILPYLIYNEARFGSPMPISGLLKSSFPLVAAKRGMLLEPGPVGLFALALGVLHLVSYVMRRGKERNLLDGAIAALVVAFLLHYAHTVLFMRWAVFRWHFMGYRVLAALALPCLLDRFSGFLPRPSRIAAGVLVIAAIILSGSERYWNRFTAEPRDHWSVAAYEAAVWARENTPKEAIFAMKDAGHFGYFSGRRVVSLDGIVGDIAFQEVLRERRLGTWLESRGVSYLVQHAFWEYPAVNDGTYETVGLTYTSRLHLVESDTLRLSCEEEIYRSSPYRDGSHETVFVIWRMDRQGIPGNND